MDRRQLLQGIVSLSYQRFKEGQVERWQVKWLQK